MISDNVDLRPPHEVMKLDRMGSFHQTRLSFMRSLLRRLKKEQWQFSRPVWDIDKNGVGVAVYTAHGPLRNYSLICYSHDLDPEKRSDRSIATEWDATFTLFDGIPDQNDLKRLSFQVPKQEAGRVSDSECSISRANRSARLFSYVVDQLAQGLQPEQTRIDAIGYLMRTTAVYGAAKFGAASRDKISSRPETSQPFQIEMLSVFLTRAFTLDLVEYLAHCKNPEKATLIKPHLRRRFGVGNSTGLGMAPFLVTHPVLLHHWISARETALAQVRTLHNSNPKKINSFKKFIQNSLQGCHSWNTSDPYQAPRVSQLKKDLQRLLNHLNSQNLPKVQPWNSIYLWTKDNLEIEAQELVVSLLIEVHPEIADDLSDTMSADERAHFCIDGAMTLQNVRNIIQENYAWALPISFNNPECQKKYWYVSENKLEPRIGDRDVLAPMGDLEMPVSIGRDVADLMNTLKKANPQETVADFLLSHPQYRHIIRRIQISTQFPYSEIQDNLLHEDALPLHMLRCKLSFFGATCFDPKSDRWTRITMFQHAPFPQELHSEDADLWIYAHGNTPS